MQCITYDLGPLNRITKGQCIDREFLLLVDCDIAAVMKS